MCRDSQPPVWSCSIIILDVNLCLKNAHAIFLDIVVCCQRKHQTQRHGSFSIHTPSPWRKYAQPSMPVSENNQRAGEEQSSVRVFARVRPLTTQEAQRLSTGDSEKMLRVVGNEIVLPGAAGRNGRTFAYDMCFSSAEGMEQRGAQIDVYAHLGPPLVECATKGFNGCLLAYGQTGSGKTHTIMGAAIANTVSPRPQALLGGGCDVEDADEGEGVLPRLIRSVFSTTRQEAAASTDASPVSYRIYARYFEVYNERIYDLLQSKANNEIAIKSVKNGTLVGAREELITSAESALHVLRNGDRRRTVAATLKNDRSSRSHAVFQILCHKDAVPTSVAEADHSSVPPILSTVSCLSLVDLAGSERQKQSGAEGQQFREMVNINLSLTTLRRVIQVLHDNAVRSSSAPGGSGAPSRGAITQAPVRESVLTSVLSPCFGGNSKTLMIINVSPAPSDLLDTVSTLEFGSVARKVVNVVSINEDKNQTLLRMMSEEIAQLRMKLDARRASIRMSRMGAELRERVDTEVGTSPARRSVGVCTSISGPEAATLLMLASTPSVEYTIDDDDADDVDQTSVDLHRALQETTCMYESLQDEVAGHIHASRVLQGQLEERDVAVSALRRQVVELERTFTKDIAALGAAAVAPPARPEDAAVGDLAPCTQCDRHVAALRAQESAHTLLVDSLNSSQEAVYAECERLRRAHLQTVTQVVELRNQLNVAEDRSMIIRNQARRINELEAQCAHHMEERLSLLMNNHRLQQLVQGGDAGPSSQNHDDEHDERAIAAEQRDRSGSTSGI